MKANRFGRAGKRRATAVFLSLMMALGLVAMTACNGGGTGAGGVPTRVPGAAGNFGGSRLMEVPDTGPGMGTAALLIPANAQSGTARLRMWRESDADEFWWPCQDYGVMVAVMWLEGQNLVWHLDVGTAGNFEFNMNRFVAEWEGGTGEISFAARTGTIADIPEPLVFTAEHDPDLEEGWLETVTVGRVFLNVGSYVVTMTATQAQHSLMSFMSMGVRPVI